MDIANIRLNLERCTGFHKVLIFVTLTHSRSLPQLISQNIIIDVFTQVKYGHIGFNLLRRSYKEVYQVRTRRVSRASADELEQPTLAGSPRPTAKYDTRTGYGRYLISKLAVDLGQVA